MDKQEEYLAYLCDRTQKITEAVYRVTDLLSEKEPLKWGVREKAIAIFTNLTSFQNKDFLEKIPSFKELETLIDSILVLLSLLSVNKSISGVNFEILKEEYASVKKFVGQEQERQDFGKLFLGETIKLPEISNGQKAIGQIDKDKSDSLDKSDRSVRPNKKEGARSKERKEKILDIVKNKKEVTIGEISGLFSEYSEKTIQRDLLEMVNKGFLRKEGDKRWRKYILC